MGKGKFSGIYRGCFIVFMLGAFMIGGCGEDLTAANEKLKKEVAELTAENERLKAENLKMRNDLSALHSQVAELNMQVSSLTDQNQALMKDIDNFKEQLKGRGRKS